MTENESRLFFPILVRNDDYPLKKNGKFYKYSRYRSHVATECKNRCVYCGISAFEAGGLESMQLDHFRPESKIEFINLVNDPRNLHLSCARCNLLKSSHWPATTKGATHDDRDGFIDPFVEDRLDYFRISEEGNLKPVSVPALYMITLLKLNREFLRKTRELKILKSKWKKRGEEIVAAFESGERPSDSQIVEVVQNLSALLSIDEL